MKKLLLGVACAAALLTGTARAQSTDQPSGMPESRQQVRRSTWPAEVAPSEVPPARELSHWREACRDDIKSLCRLSYSQEEVEACLSRNADKVSDGCRRAQELETQRQGASPDKGRR